MNPTNFIPRNITMAEIKEAVDKASVLDKYMGLQFLYVIRKRGQEEKMKESANNLQRFYNRESVVVPFEAKS